MEKKFYHYLEHDGHIILNEVNYPHCPIWEEYHKSFLVYAEDENAAFKLAMRHIYDGLKINKFYGVYAGERWDGIPCVM